MEERKSHADELDPSLDMRDIEVLRGEKVTVEKDVSIIVKAAGQRYNSP
jgi:hypothetical protein